MSLIINPYVFASAKKPLLMISGFVGGVYRMIYSRDGITWTTNTGFTVPSNYSWYAVGSLSGTPCFLAGENSNVNSYLYTNDPMAGWTGGTVPGTAGGSGAFSATENVIFSQAGSGSQRATALSGPWTAISTVNARKVIHDGTVFVAAGTNAIYTAASASGTWTNRASATYTMNDVAKGDDGLYVAVGVSGAMRTATSPTGTWISRTSSFGSDNINGVCKGASYWVAVGNAGKIATATDPTGTWTQRTSGTSDAINKVVYNAALGLYVASTTSGILTATDPTGPWTARTTPSSTAVRGILSLEEW
ncbi:MAG: hypothetical protein M9937_15540 [Chelatococcus sp.]|uniref:hypothetical protein n=1 Tax=Chelatococcus sp. TaxID=1953771 RepID=UPI002636E5E4|nr:hypothetical protein [Chelatococcus sp.]MCO5077084.1 hypothetical protein [Chelatococcus sp.]